MSSRRKTRGPGGAKDERHGPGRRDRPSPARALAFEVLRALEDGRGQPASLFERHAPETLSGVDRDLANELVHGVLRWRARLDAVAETHARRSAASLDPAVRICLRIGLYQLGFLDRVPRHAAVDESVRLAKSFGAARAAGLVNAVLRSASRRPQIPELPDRDDPSAWPTDVEALALASSHPAWLVARYLERLSLEDVKKRLAIHNEPPPVYLRVSRRIELEEAAARLAAEGVVTRPCAFAPRGLLVLEGRFHGSGLAREGLAFVQDEGSQLVPLLLGVGASDDVLDICAAPGGKSTLLAELASQGSVTALELRPGRARAMAARARDRGASRLRTVVADGRRLPLRRDFSRVLLDVPCSSLGTLRHNPDIKWRLREDDLAPLAKRQRELASAAARHVAPGGRLLYATCSTEPEENDAVVESFLAAHPDFELVRDLEALLPPAARHLVRDGFFETRPERDDADAYFAALLERR